MSSRSSDRSAAPRAMEATLEQMRACEREAGQLAAALSAVHERRADLSAQLIATDLEADDLATHK